MLNIKQPEKIITGLVELGLAIQPTLSPRSLGFYLEEYKEIVQLICFSV